MAPETTPPSGATRYIQTTRGLLTYSQLAPLLAERVLKVRQKIADGEFASRDDFPEILLQLHSEIAGDLCPEWAGRWRDAEVRVGEHHPPPPYQVPLLMRGYGADLKARIQAFSGPEDSLLFEFLAFAEGRLLSIHPFTDFNGRVTRLFLRELLRRLNLPPVELAPMAPTKQAAYRAALRAGDVLNWRPLMEVWQERFERFPA